jgi:hypothetical protein
VKVQGLTDSELVAEAERLLAADREAHSWDSPGRLAAWLTDGGEMQAGHLDLIDQAAVEIAEGRRQNVLITMPPRHGKSRRAARWLPLWYLRRFPNRRIIVASHGGDLADEHGRWVRDTIEEHAGQNGEKDLGLRLDPSSSAANRWDLLTNDVTNKGGMRTVGVGGSITGRGAHLIIVDDPVKDAETADSPLYRERQWDWWTQTLLTRREPGAAVIVIQTRWHQDDLAGRIIAKAGDRG